MSKELLPCPFCGGKAVIRIDATRPYTYRDRLRVGCETAGCRGFYHAAWVYYETSEQATEAWNMRAQGTCKVEEYEDTGIPVCSECGAIQPEDHTVYHCWCCGRRVEG